MKKLIAGLFAAVLMAGGLVGFSGAPANAVCGDRYTGPCPPTQAQVNEPKKKVFKKGAKPKIKFKARAADGTQPSGKVVIIVRLPGGGTKKVTYKYDGGKEKFSLPKLGKVGQYKVTVKFIPKGKYRADVNRFKVRVRR